MQRSNYSRTLAPGVGSLAIFLIIAALVFSDLSQNLDAQLALAIYNTNLGVTFASIMILFSQYGREVVWVGVVVLMLLFGKSNTKLLAVELAILFVVGIVAGDITKLVAYRPRPFDTVTGIEARIPETDSSFPSGHALIVSIGAIFALSTLKKGKKARLTGLLLTIEAATVSYSRIYLGVHYPLDVIGAVFLAGAIVFIGLFVLERYLGRSTRQATNAIEKILKTLRIPEII